MGKGVKVKCMKCGAIIQSMHVHDMQHCRCGAIAIDGGSDYWKASGDCNDIYFLKEEMTLHDLMEEARAKEIMTENYVDTCMRYFKNCGIKVEGKTIYSPIGENFLEDEIERVNILIKYHNYELQENLPLKF